MRAATGRPLAALGLALLALATMACQRQPPPEVETLASIAALLPFGESECPAGREIRAEGDRLFLPAGCRADVFLEVPPGASVAWESVRARGEVGPLGLSWIEDAGRERSRSVAVRAKPGAMRLATEGVVRIRLHAPPAEATGGLLVEGMAVVVPRREEAAAQVARPATLPEQPHIVVYLIDTLRADAVTALGGAPGASPAFDALTAEATLFSGAVAQSAWTRSAVASIFTGLIPPRHGVLDRHDALPEGLGSLPDLLAAVGYRTMGVTDNPNVDGRWGMARGFDQYRTLWRRAAGRTTVHDAFFRWLDEGEGEGVGDTPFFAYLHTVEPHSPYDPPEPFRGDWAPDVPWEVGTLSHLKELHGASEPPPPHLVDQLAALYRGEVAWSDRNLQVLVEGLRSRELWSDTVLVVVSDHGEELYEHGGWEHGHSLHGESIDVPLLVRVPGVAEGVRLDAPAQHVDLPVTLLGLAGAPVPPDLDGRDLLELMTGDGTARDPPIVSYLDLDGEVRGALTLGRWRWIERLGEGAEGALYDRHDDPGETQDLASERPIRAGYLRSLLRAAMAKSQLPRITVDDLDELDEGDAETVQALRALGYLD